MGLHYSICSHDFSSSFSSSSPKATCSGVGCVSCCVLPRNIQLREPLQMPLDILQRLAGKHRVPGAGASLSHRRSFGRPVRAAPSPRAPPSAESAMAKELRSVGERNDAGASSLQKHGCSPGVGRVLLRGFAGAAAEPSSGFPEFRSAMIGQPNNCSPDMQPGNLRKQRSPSEPSSATMSAPHSTTKRSCSAS